MAIFTLYTSNIIQFSQSITTHPFQVNTSNFLSFTQKVKVSPIYVSTSNQLHFTQVVISNRSIINVSVSNMLRFSQKASRVIEVSIFQNFFPFQIPGPQTNIDYPKPSNQLTLSQTVTPVVSKPTSNLLQFTQAISTAIIKNFAVVSTFDIRSNVTAHIENKYFISIPVPPPSAPAGDNGRCEA